MSLHVHGLKLLPHDFILSMVVPTKTTLCRSKPSYNTNHSKNSKLSQLNMHCTVLGQYKHGMSDTIHTCTYMYMYIHTCTHVCIHCIHTCMYIHAYIHTYIHTCTWAPHSIPMFWQQCMLNYNVLQIQQVRKYKNINLH